MTDNYSSVTCMEGGKVCKINCQVEDGLIPSERVVRFDSLDGRREEVSVSERQVEGNTLLASEIHSEGDKVLVELPRESASGRWRVWVSKKQLGR
jgi:hypothetical protein